MFEDGFDKQPPKDFKTYLKTRKVLGNHKALKILLKKLPPDWGLE